MAWKNSYIQHTLLEKIQELKQSGKQSSVKTWCRSSTILSSLVGFRFRVHNGKDFFPLVITEEMVGHKLGEFAPTRAKYEFKKKKKKK